MRLALSMAVDTLSLSLVPLSEEEAQSCLSGTSKEQSRSSPDLREAIS